MNLSPTEEAALELLKMSGGCFLVSTIPDRNEPGVFGDVTPGIRVYKALEKKGLVYFTEEDPFILDDGTVFEFTPSVYLVEKVRYVY